ncbi:type II toxin-antitoxin system RelE/ParE family toxin [Granulicella tundricola]|uniref:Plasmid stabilization system n=1 Tax=Granulicella tundricola (strain ATCC BAA-1859 / DSM 23138 / MP5ACTX9) TaxID=1198114 RepID=E8X230_GRATM|nr:type II toxin-antitoxin system RelE/ParE family toxin [Granulicella tundricola]ADW70273.1 plasmid stabilization system [Granulicella tundricola MP5ACTX9]
MKALLFSRRAEADFHEISEYLGFLPARPSLRIAEEIQRAFNLIVQFPYLGQAHSRFTTLHGQEVRSLLVASYRIYYFSTSPPEIIAILHGARDQTAIMSQRTT